MSKHPLPWRKTISSCWAVGNSAPRAYALCASAASLRLRDPQLTACISFQTLTVTAGINWPEWVRTGVWCALNLYVLILIAGRKTKKKKTTKEMIYFNVLKKNLDRIKVSSHKRLDCWKSWKSHLPINCMVALRRLKRWGNTLLLCTSGGLSVQH